MNKDYIKGFESTMMKVLSKKTEKSMLQAVERTSSQLEMIENKEYKIGAMDALNEIKFMMKR